ncbi:hypothetical protein MPTK1_6g16270 [Marchantia polymorpha subsp. ruderalis]|uniref:DUF4704 domain-containing protein n=2 Tax=Marchantia polymorpha TaxID=3197 RepID=A0AAF6BSM8_MARPO|nr:hypothetical protein MARPO_0056s0137 [Marchantia polymorpha]BBN15012.1 hypothetical protein Mp_6g16270 [Marchantia polymorpha subsp. ruderalis]|eukprot:PTQ37695.1 hypothetical protein MARPO_0056s0137 [Marchantia polymorpha]
MEGADSDVLEGRGVEVKAKEEEEEAAAADAGNESKEGQIDAGAGSRSNASGQDPEGEQCGEEKLGGGIKADDGAGEEVGAPPARDAAESQSLDKSSVTGKEVMTVSTGEDHSLPESPMAFSTPSSQAESRGYSRHALVESARSISSTASISEYTEDEDEGTSQCSTGLENSPLTAAGREDQMQASERRMPASYGSLDRDGDHGFEQVSLQDPGGTETSDSRLNSIERRSSPVVVDYRGPGRTNSEDRHRDVGSKEIEIVMVDEQEQNVDRFVGREISTPTKGRISDVSLTSLETPQGSPQSEPYIRDTTGSSRFRYNQSFTQKADLFNQNGSFFETQLHAGTFENFLYPQGNLPNLAKVLPKTSPELMHLIDSAIQNTDLYSLLRLKRVVAGEDHLAISGEVKKDTDSVAAIVVDVLLAKMGIDGSQKASEGSPPKIMLSAGAAIVAAKLLPWLPCEEQSEEIASPRTRMAKGLALVLQSCTRNRAMCSAAGLLQVLLETVRDIFTVEVAEETPDESWDSTPLLDALEALGSHCMTVMDLREWLSTAVVSIPTGKSTDLVLSLERAMVGEETRGPSYTFEFDGESSGLLGPAESRWPFMNGYAIATWLFIESFADTVNTAAAAAAIAAAAAAKTGKSSAMSAAAAASALAGEGMAHMPRLFSFLSADNHGVEAYFHGQFLVVETANGRGKKASMHFTHAFKPRQWYFIGLEHTYKQTLLGKTESEVRLYVDGQLYETRPLEYPRVSRALGFCCIGTNPPPAMAGLQRRRRQCPLFAEMGPVYIFKETIGPDRMARLAARGGDALPSFNAGAGVPWFANSEQAFAAATDSATLDIELGPRLHLLYHPKLLMGRLCPDASPSGASGLHRKPAEVLGHVHLAVRTRPTEALWAMGEGGPMALLPLTVGAVDKDSFLPVIGDVDLSAAVAMLSAPIFRILSVAFQHPGNAEEMARSYAPRLLAYLLGHLVSVPALGEAKGRFVDQVRTEERDEELVSAVVSLAQAPKNNFGLKVQLYGTLLLDLKLWYRCAYGLQKKLLSTLADLAFTEALTMRGANAVQLLLDGCRRCYWVIPEADSLHLYAGGRSSRPVGELNALVDELLVVVELLVGSAPLPLSGADVSSLVQFVLDCPQPNQVARVLHLIYRLVVQPNSGRAALFAETLLASGAVEMLLILLQREADLLEPISGILTVEDNTSEASVTISESSRSNSAASLTQNEGGSEISSLGEDSAPRPEQISDVPSGLPPIKVRGSGSTKSLADKSRPRLPSLRIDVPGQKKYAGRNLGGISLSISADTARNNFRNVDSGDGIMVGVVSLVGALISGGFLKLISFSSAATIASGKNSSENASLGEGGIGIAVGIGTWMMYALRQAFEAAPKRLLTDNVYSVILHAVVRLEMGSLASQDRLMLYDSGHRFEHVDLLLVLLQSLPFASPTLQHRALQDILFLGCIHPENRSILTAMPEWPEWLLEVLISNYEVVPGTRPDGLVSFEDVEELVYSFITIMLEYSMRLKDGWKDVEAMVHCAEWLAMIGGSSIGEQRLRREESLPIIKRKLLGGLLDFAARELRLQTQVVATAAAGVAAEGLSPRAARAEAEAVAQLSMSLAENALVVLMLVEDHLRLQCQVYGSNSLGSTTGQSTSPGTRPPSSEGSYDFAENPVLRRVSSSYDKSINSLLDLPSPRRYANGNEPSGVSLEVLASMADANGHISAAAMERLTASTAAEPYEAVRGAFVSFGTCGPELGDGWKRRSRMWYGVGLPAPNTALEGGGGGWKVWKTSVERDEHGEWVDLPLVRKCVAMLQSLLLDDSGPGGGGVGFGGGAGTGSGGAHALQQLLDSDQIFFTMLRMVLLSLREEDKGDLSAKRDAPTEIVRQISKFSLDPTLPSESLHALTMKKAKTSLLWCILAPLITMPLSEARRQRVLVAVCILYSEIWHAVSRDRVVLRKHYVETIFPPFTALLRRWRPLLSGTHELTDADGQSPLSVEDRSIDSNTLPLEASLSMISPAWAATFASPPAAMALAMAAAGVGGGEAITPKTMFGKRELDPTERKTFRLRSFQKLPDSPKPSAPPKDKASGKAAAAAAAREQERNAKIGSGRGLGAVAMATSTHRRNLGDKERAKRWNLLESMNTAWDDCSFLTATSTVDPPGKYFSKLQGILHALVETASTLRTAEMKRRALSAAADEFGAAVGAHSWKSLTHRLLEIEALFGLLEQQIGHPQQVFWKLDSMENSMRMRRRLKRNYKGTDHHGAAADFEEVEEVTTPKAKIVDADAAFAGTPLPAGAPKLMPESNMLEDTGIQSSRNSVGDSEERKEESQAIDNGPQDPSANTSEGGGVTSSTAVHSSLSMAAAAAAIVTEPKEKLLLEIPGAMVQPLKVLRGRFQVTTKRICFMIDDRVHVDESGIASLDDDEGPRSSTDHFEKEGATGTVQRNEGAKDRLWPLSVLWEIHSRRYLLRRSALELFMVDRSNFFFNFGTEDNRKKVYKALVQARPPHLNHIYASTQRPESLLKRTQLMERWARHEISNFEYLMQLNTLAGRSYNDLTQYPVFPWILSDYTSKVLNLDDPNVYRDLSKPVGALNPSRLEKFLERYDNFDDPVIPKFHYGSHYSSAGTVLYYLVRMEPFSTLSIDIQGGKFDHADRMFFDMSSTWNGVLEDMSDVKELVPELFYMPEILVNKNEVYLGKTQKGEVLGNVKLPPWAANDVDFVQKHRAALESEYVSANLHKWIDLIFGYKQRGKDAVASTNVFFYMTYEGAVDIDKITDPILRKATQDQITYFGQTPSQLLTTPHIKRMALEEVLHLQTIFRNPKATKIYVIPSPERLNVPAAKLCVSRDSIVTIGMDAPACTVASHRWQPNTPDGRGTPFLFQHGKSHASASSGAFIRMFRGQTAATADEVGYPRAVALAAPGIDPGAVVDISPDGRHLFTGGHADNTLKVVSTENARVIESASGHYAAITCVASSPDGSVLVTGSRDATAIIWRIHGNSGSVISGSNTVSDPTLVAAAASVGPTNAEGGDTGGGVDGRRRRIEGPVHVLRGHVDELLCCTVNADLDLVVTSSLGRGVLLHSITRGRLLQKLPIGRADIIAVSSEGNIVLWDKLQRIVHAFTINGTSIAAKVFQPTEGSITSMIFSTDGLHIVMATSQSRSVDPDSLWRGKRVHESDSDQKGAVDPSCRYETGQETNSGMENGQHQGVEVTDADPAPTIIIFKTYTLEVVHRFCLQNGQDVTAMAMNDDNTNLLVSTANGQLLVFTDPVVCLMYLRRGLTHLKRQDSQLGLA